VAAPLDPNYRAHLQALGDMFAASVPARMAAIADALVPAGAPPDREQLARLQAALHTVAGSAGSFGFTVLGEQARRLEQAVRGLMNEHGGNMAGWTELLPQIQAYLDWASDDPRATTYLPHD
jgi:chemotaxis protein histidine kinase CheA